MATEERVFTCTGPACSVTVTRHGDGNGDVMFTIKNKGAEDGDDSYRQLVAWGGYNDSTLSVFAAMAATGQELGTISIAGISGGYCPKCRVKWVSLDADEAQDPNYWYAEFPSQETPILGARHEEYGDDGHPGPNAEGLRRTGVVSIDGRSGITNTDSSCCEHVYCSSCGTMFMFSEEFVIDAE